jgi:hypothetical protein
MLSAQVDFESLSPGATLYWKGNPGIPGLNSFSDGGAIFYNQNDTSSFGDYWSGWAYSAKEDTISVDYATNDISAITGKGYNNSANYGVAYVGWDSSLNRIRFSDSKKLAGCYITNTTIAYRSMQSGDGFAKKFGGSTGNDPDFFRLHITGWLGGNPKPDTLTFYLADFRDSNQANDYIINQWTFVDLSALGITDSLCYWMASSDTNSFGIKTPTYFCIDNLAFDPLNVATVISNNNLQIYPNPAHQQLSIARQNAHPVRISVMDKNGRAITNCTSNTPETVTIPLHSLPAGVYHLQVSDQFGTQSTQFIKN